MKKSYGYIPRNRVRADAAQGQASCKRHSLNSSSAVLPVAISMLTSSSHPALSLDNIDSQLLRFFKEYE